MAKESGKGYKRSRTLSEISGFCIQMLMLSRCISIRALVLNELLALDQLLQKADGANLCFVLYLQGQLMFVIDFNGC